MSKNLSNSFSTGSGGAHFEACVQAAFITLMLTGGYAPCLPCWPIVGIKLQGKVEGYDTDDLIVTIEEPNTKERCKLLGQVKHSIHITRNNVEFRDVIRAAWDDFNRSNFRRNKDAIVLITGPLNRTDEHNVQWLLRHAKHTNTVDTFLLHVKKAKFSPQKSNEKLEVFRKHLSTANGAEITDNDLYNFLKHFHLLDYDLDKEFGVVLSLLHSHISQLQPKSPESIWSTCVNIAQTWNKDAGTITRGNLPEYLRDFFKPPHVDVIPEEFNRHKNENLTDWTYHPDATCLAHAILIGGWDEKNTKDIEIVSLFLELPDKLWLQKIREILNKKDGPLSLENGIWSVKTRIELWDQLASRIFDQSIDTFKSIIVSVLKEIDPALELPSEERYAASVYGKILEHSHALRKGLAEGLAILGNYSDKCKHCSRGKIEGICIQVIREIFDNADWRVWGSLGDVLPILAEAAPDTFLQVVEKALRMTPCPFDDLFAQEGTGITGSNYLTDLLWALEGLAWDEKFLVRVCILLGELACRDPGGQWINRPFHSLVTILLPWLPQTLAPIDKCEVAVQTLLQEQPNVGWKLLIEFLPDQHQTSSGSYKPNWRRIIPDGWEKGVTDDVYWQQVSSYAELVVKAADNDITKLMELVDHFENLPQPAFDKFIEILTSLSTSTLPEEQRYVFWDHLVRFTNQQRQFPDDENALSNEILSSIEKIANQFVPTNLFYLYRPLFSDRVWELLNENEELEEQEKELYKKRKIAIKSIFQKKGIEGVILFSEKEGVLPNHVGYVLAALDEKIIERTLLPGFLNDGNKIHGILVQNFVSGMHRIKGWKWCDDIDKSCWALEQISLFLISLPFSKGTWDRASSWLGEHQDDYWCCAVVNAYDCYHASGDLDYAIEKLIEHDRSYSAINCLYWMFRAKQPIKIETCVTALLEARSCSESPNTDVGHHIVELIKYLQSEPSAPHEGLFQVELAYLLLLNRHSVATPKLLEKRLADEPEFFCEAIRLAYRSTNEKQQTKEHPKQSTDFAIGIWQLLRGWKTPPGTSVDGSFDAERFNEWLDRVKIICTESGHIEIALVHIGEVLIYVPNDPGGLWIHQAVAAALNEPDAEDMRHGFHTGTYNSRGSHLVDPSGAPEKNLAEQFRQKAEYIENAGFHRFATTLKGIAETYEQEARLIVDEYQHESQ